MDRPIRAGKTFLLSSTTLTDSSMYKRSIRISEREEIQEDLYAFARKKWKDERRGGLRGGGEIFRGFVHCCMSVPTNT